MVHSFTFITSMDPLDQCFTTFLNLQHTIISNKKVWRHTQVVKQSKSDEKVLFLHTF
jgi:hypothetical protein